MLTQHNSSTIYSNKIISKFQCKLEFKLQLYNLQRLQYFSNCSLPWLNSDLFFLGLLERWLKVEERFVKMVQRPWTKQNLQFNASASYWWRMCCSTDVTCQQWRRCHMTPRAVFNSLLMLYLCKTIASVICSTFLYFNVPLVKQYNCFLNVA